MTLVIDKMDGHSLSNTVHHEYLPRRLRYHGISYRRTTDSSNKMVCVEQKVSHGTVKQCHQYLPVTSSLILSVAVTVLITTSHWITLPSSVVLNCEIV